MPSQGSGPEAIRCSDEACQVPLEPNSDADLLRLHCLVHLAHTSLYVTLITAVPARVYRVEQTRTLKHCHGYQSLLLPTISTRCFNSLLIIAAVIQRAVNTVRDLPPRACNNGLRHHKIHATGNKHLPFFLVFPLGFCVFLFYVLLSFRLFTSYNFPFSFFPCLFAYFRDYCFSVSFVTKVFSFLIYSL